MPASLRPYAKAVVPFVLTIIAVLGQWFVTGELDRAELVTAITGALAALVTYAVPNTPDADDDSGLPADAAPPEADDFEVSDPDEIPADVGDPRSAA